MKITRSMANCFSVLLLILAAAATPASVYASCFGNSEVVAEYLFIEGSGNTAINTGTDGDDGNAALTNGASFNTNAPPSNGACGWSVQLPNSGSGTATPALETADFYDPFDGASNFTIMAWVRRESPASGSNMSARIVSDTSSLTLTNTTAGVEFRFSGSAGALYLRVNGNEVGTTSASISPTSAVWTHVAVVYDGTRPATNYNTRNVHFYVNGVQTGSGNTLQDAVVGSNTNQLTLGNSSVNRGNANALVGKMDDVLILYGVSPDAVGNGKTNETIQCYMNLNDDIEDPDISPPANVTTNADPGICGSTNINLGLPSADDNCGIADISNDAPSTFPSGATYVLWTATDYAGNFSVCTQLVTVVDAENPVVVCPSNVDMVVQACQIPLTNLDLGTPVYSDNCAVVMSGPAGIPAAFYVGTTSIVWEAWDAAGNYGACTQLVTVSVSTNYDCDSDGLSDADELAMGTNPAEPDTDGDGLLDGEEVYDYNTDPLLADTDGDGMPDGWEATNDFNPRSDLETGGLVAWWQFNDGAGSVASNSADTNYTGVLQNMDNGNWTVGVLDGALSFDGLDEYVSVAQPQAIISGGPFTIMAVLNLDGDYLADLPTVISDCKQASDSFSTAGSGVPAGWGGGAIAGGGDGTADWVVHSNGNHEFRAVFEGTGSATAYAKSRNSFITRSLAVQPATPQQPQEWAFNISYDSTNATEASDNNRMRVWIWADGTNLATANGYAVEYGEENSDDRVRLWRMSGGTKGNFPIVSSGAAVLGGDVQFSVHVRREINGKWTLWSSGNTAANNAFPTSDPLSIVADEQIGYDAAWNVQGDGWLGFQTFIQTGSNTSRRLALDDFTVKGRLQGYAIRHSDVLSGIAGDSATTSYASALEEEHPYLNRWQTLAMVNDGTNLSLYVSGVLATNVPCAFSAAIQPYLYIGRGHDLPADTFIQGDIDDLRIYDHALTNLVASGIYDAINDPDGDGLINVDEYNNGTDPHDDDTDNDGMSDSWEIANGLDPLVGDASGDPDGDGMSNLVEFQRNLSAQEWNGIQDIIPVESVVIATNPNPYAQFTYMAYEAQQVAFSFYDFHYAIDPVSGDFDTNNSVLIAQIVTNAVAGTNVFTWDGIVSNGLLHGASVLQYEALSTETDGGGHSELYAPQYVEGGAPIYAVYDAGGSANAYENRPAVFRTGDNGMSPLLVHSVVYPNLIENRLIVERTAITNFIPYNANGRPATPSDPFPAPTIVSRVVPGNSILYMEQHATMLSYSVEAYRTTPALASVVHAVFALDREAKFSAEIYDPDGNAYPVYEDGTNLVQGLTLAAGGHDMEFTGANYSTGEALLFPARPAGDRTYSVKFTVEDLRTGHVEEDWATLRIIH